jgi:hypothetical protein
MNSKYLILSRNPRGVEDMHNKEITFSYRLYYIIPEYYCKI